MSDAMPIQSSQITVTETGEGRDFWLSLGLGAGIESDLASADALIVPVKDFREGVPYVFHQDTIALFRYLEENLSGQLKIEICANDDEYVEISLHSGAIRISRLVLTWVIAPLVLNVLGDYIYDRLKANPMDLVEASIVVQDHQCKNFNFEFQGPAKDFHLLASEVAQLARDCENHTHENNKPHHGEH